MKRSLYKIMKTDRKIFRNHIDGKNDSDEIFHEHFPMLERCIMQAINDCRKAEKRLDNTDFLSELFEKCTELCIGGILPDSEEIVSFFTEKLSGRSLEYLPLALTCAVIHFLAVSLDENNSEKTKNCVKSLQKMRETDFAFISEMLFSAEKILENDPSGFYSDLSPEIKVRYRRKISVLATGSKKSELDFAADILKKSKEKGCHIGDYLFSTVKNKKYGIFCIAAEIIIPILICAAVGIFSGEWIFSLFLYFPIWQIVRYPIERASVRNIRAEKFLSLDPASKTVSDVNAMIVLSVILPSADKMSEIGKKLENVFFSNACENIGICCLADFKAADMPRKSEDKYILNSLNDIIAGLNKKYGGGFVSAVRPRCYSQTQNEFIGKERKRGAIRELIRYIKGDEKGFLSVNGDVEILKKSKYLIILDSDTRPVFDSVRELVAVAEHPINKPFVKNGKVVSGYGILAPKMQTSLASAGTFFGNIMSASTGISYYDENSSERYQNLFGESIFCGKGLINVDVYHEILDNALPKEIVLSHDIIEGEYLRTGFVPQVQMIEDFPTSSDAYFKRMHRWIRGDWQNIGFIFSKNPLGFVSRYKIFDNLRRSITPAISLGVILASAFYHSYAGIFAAIVAAFSVCSSDIFDGISALVRFGSKSLTGLYYSKKLPESLGCFARGFFSLAYSARESFVSLDAITKSLWRMFVSGDNLLEWTVSGSEKKNKSVALPVSCLPALLVSSLLIVFGLPIHRLLGIIILSDIPLTLFANSPFKTKKSDITESQRDFLVSEASAIWKYFEDFCTEKNNFLPPDNIQFAPHRALAKRTSPTNIGLMLVSFLAARDFGFITSQELYDRLNKSFESIGKLEKCKGNLLNWYDISSLKTLSPRFVSAVDSGNFICCLTALKQGVTEYEHECKELGEIAEIAEKMISSTDMGVMYNRQRKLFHIGINPDDGKKTESCYDLYMSEIRMTAYLAVARKFVPKNHWNSLDRPYITSGRYTGLASWTGTMFEYFMADIFLPSPEGSLSNEALKFCLQCQRKKAGRNPFGISESAFYSFDSDLNYQYKAHGVQKLGLKRGLDKENVISPYSSFLTLNIAPHLSINNLKRLEKLGAKGKYGFCEAVDFTKGRNNSGYSVVNSFMVHHLAMSFLSIDNLINGGCMQNRFMSDRFMKGAETLLEEKVIISDDEFRDIASDTVIPLIRERFSVNRSSWYYPDESNPCFYAFSNGRMTLCICDNGDYKAILDGEEIGIIDGFEFYEKGMQVRAEKDSIRFKNEKTNTSSEVFLLRKINCVIHVKSEKSELKEGCIKKNGVHVKSGFINNDKNKTFEIFSIDVSEEDATNSFEYIKNRKSKYEKATNPFRRDEFQRAMADKFLGRIILSRNEADEYPVLLKEIDTKEQIEEVKPLVIFNKILRNCGIKNTLIICNNLPKDEKTSLLQTIETVMHEGSCELMLGIGGGTVIFDPENQKNSDFKKLKEKCIRIGP